MRIFQAVARGSIVGGAALLAWAGAASAQSTCTMNTGTATAAGFKSFACGPDSNSQGAYTVAIGDASAASMNGATALGASSVASQDSTAVGSGASATGTGAVANGAAADARGYGGVALGTSSRTGYDAEGIGNTAVGYSAYAGGTAVGQTHSTALGAYAWANASRATAIGFLSQAKFDDSAAIGQGAVTTRAYQMMLGRSDNTYTLAGLASAESLAAQTGPIRFVTSDLSGNLAVSAFDPSTLATASSVDALDGRVGALNNEVGALKGELGATRTEARQGIAAAIAMSSAPMPSAPGRTSWAANVGFFKGETAFGGSLSHRLDFNNPIAVSLGYSYGGDDSHAARFGMLGEF